MNPAIGKRLVLVNPPHVHEDFIEAAILDRRDDLRSDRLRVADAFRVDIDQEHVVSRCHFRDGPGLAFLELRGAGGAQFPKKSGNGGERWNAWAIRPMDGERDQPDRQEPDDAARDREQPAHTSLVECDATLEDATNHKDRRPGPVLWTRLVRRVYDARPALRENG